jgi:hypothetical protein
VAAQSTALSGALGDVEVADAGFYPSTTERPLGTKAAKRRKRSLESSAPSEVVSSVQNLTEGMRESDALYARNQKEKLLLHQESNSLHMYETLYLHASSTASYEERAFAESKMHSLFLESLGNRPGRADGATTALQSASPTHAQPYPSQAGHYADAPREHASLTKTEEERPTKTQRNQIENVDAPHVHGSTELTENTNYDSESDC